MPSPSPTSKPESREVRQYVEGFELRAAPEGSRSPGTLMGYAAVFGKESCDLGFFRERLAPNCFRSALSKSDVRALFNHDPSMLLGRTSAGTLRLMEDAQGLRMEVDLPDTSLGRDVAELTRRGDLQGQSFSFTTAPDGSGVKWDTASEPWTRTVSEIAELFDVGPVTFPAYEETSVAMRQFRSLSEASAPPPVHLIESERDHARLRLLEVS